VILDLKITHQKRESVIAKEKRANKNDVPERKVFSVVKNFLEIHINRPHGLPPPPATDTKSTLAAVKKQRSENLYL